MRGGGRRAAGGRRTARGARAAAGAHFDNLGGEVDLRLGHRGDDHHDAARDQAEAERVAAAEGLLHERRRDHAVEEDADGADGRDERGRRVPVREQVAALAADHQQDADPPQRDLEHRLDRVAVGVGVPPVRELLQVERERITKLAPTAIATPARLDHDICGPSCITREMFHEWGVQWISKPVGVMKHSGGWHAATTQFCRVPPGAIGAIRASPIAAAVRRAGRTSRHARSARTGATRRCANG